MSLACVNRPKPRFSRVEGALGSKRHVETYVWYGQKRLGARLRARVCTLQDTTPEEIRQETCDWANILSAASSQRCLLETVLGVAPAIPGHNPKAICHPFLLGGDRLLVLGM